MVGQHARGRELTLLDRVNKGMGAGKDAKADARMKRMTGGKGGKMDSNMDKKTDTRRTVDKIATVIFYAAAGIVLCTLVFLIGYIGLAGWEVLDWEFISSPSKNLAAGGGILWQIFDSMYLLVLSMLFTVPIGLGCAVYLSEYARPGPLTSIVNMAVDTLASLPSIVVGLFGLLIFVTYVGWGYSILAGTVALFILTLPVMVSVSLDALRAVPMELREASLALGATTWQTVCRVVVPSALPGLITGTLLIAGRVFGEAAVLIYTAGMSAPPLSWANLNPLEFTSPFNVMRPAETLAVHIWKVNSEGLLPDARRVADGTAFVLVIVVLVINGLARYLGGRIERKMKGIS